MTLRRSLFVVGSLVLALGIGACASPANFNGMYTVAITNDPDMCGFAGWTNGMMNSATATITQASGASAATLQVTGAAAISVSLLVGGADLAGSVSGSSADFTRDGTANLMSGAACTYHVNMDVSVTLSGDTLTGVVTYTPVTNHDPSCGLLNSCHDTQRIVGARPPST